MPWYLIHTKPTQEERAAQNLEKQGYTIFFPRCQVQRTRRNKLVHLIEPLFARYLFIQLDDITSNWYPIRSTRGVHALVRFGTNSDPVSVPDQLIAQLKLLQEQSDLDGRPAIALFESNQALAITSGPFVGLSGLFQKLHVSEDGQARALLLVEILGKPQSLSFDLVQVQKI
jgi:transcriptional antiterminator RfaH